MLIIIDPNFFTWQTKGEDIYILKKKHAERVLNIHGHK